MENVENKLHESGCAEGMLKNVKIIGMGKKLPQTGISNETLAEFLDTSDEWILSKTGIKTRTICTDESLTDLAVAASQNALDNAGLSAADIDMVICATVTGDYSMPSLACQVLEHLKISCPAFDINAACTGFIYALDVADSFIKSGKAKNILIVCAEMMSRVVDWKDRTSCILFGDGAGACIVTTGNSLKYIRTLTDAQTDLLFTKSGRGNSPFSSEETPGFLQMQGQHVYKFAVKTIEQEITLALATLNKSANDIDYFILHQANARIINGARTRLKLPPEKFPMNIQKYGNMSAASIPVLLAEMQESGHLQKGNTLLLLGFGAGMTAGTAIIEW